MKDWSLLAKAGGVDIPAKELARIVPVLSALDEAFRPLTRSLTADMEPCPVFRAGEENS
jgi:hypothetical protein